MLFLEIPQGLNCRRYRIVHESRTSGGCCGYQSVEVIDGFSEAAVVVDDIIEEEQRDDVLEVVGDCAVGKGLEERFDSPDSLQVGLVEEPTAH